MFPGGGEVTKGEVVEGGKGGTWEAEGDTGSYLLGSYCREGEGGRERIRGGEWAGERRGNQGGSVWLKGEGAHGKQNCFALLLQKGILYSISQGSFMGSKTLLLQKGILYSIPFCCKRGYCTASHSALSARILL